MSFSFGPHFSSFQEFLRAAKTHIVVIAPFINSQALDRLLHEIDGPAISVVTTWRTADILRHASDLNVYPLLRERGAHFYLHGTLHAKLLVIDWTSVIVTSANVTFAGLGIGVPSNIECATPTLALAPIEELWIRRLLADSVLIQDDTFSQLQEQLQVITDVELPPLPQLDLSQFDERKDFLLSSLPMSDSPHRMLALLGHLASGIVTQLDEELHAALHDAALYKMPIAPEEATTRELLQRRFFEHPFIRAFLRFVGDSAYFGESKAWLQKNCTNVPVPRRRTVTSHARVLFDWIVELGAGRYRIDRPSHSERLVRVVRDTY